jgi:dTDP-D-glucose 4,6-dehydratase
MQGLTGRKFTLHGSGQNRRRFLAAEDFADALVILLTKGAEGAIYNIGSEHEFTNLEIAKMIAGHLGLRAETMIEFVEDRPFNDCRYAIDSSKLRALGWEPRRPLIEHLDGVVRWYRENMERYADLYPPVGKERALRAIKAV